MTIEFEDIPFPQPETEAAPVPGRGDRAALRVLQIGLMAVVVAVWTQHSFELDRFFVPKEIVLHATAVLGALFAFRSIVRQIGSRVDRFLVLYLLLGAASAALATNRWLGWRAFAISASSVIVKRSLPSA